jgi:O-antigen ligase
MSAPRRRAGAVLERIAVGCLVAVPPAMAIAHRSSPLFVALAALAALGAAAAEDRLSELGRDLAEALSSPIGSAARAFLAWAMVSAAWSPSGPHALAALAEFVLPSGAAVILALTLPMRMARSSVLLLAGGMMLASVIILADLASGLALRKVLGLRADPFVLNRPALTLLVLLPVAVWLLVRDGRRWLALGLAILVAAAILRSESGAAKLGLTALVAAGGLTLLARRAGLALVGAALLTALAVAPVAGEIADRALPGAVYRALARAHAQDRVDIWRSFGAALREQPVLGTGFNSTARMGEAPVAKRVAPDFATLLAVGHPHNAALQIWVELGAVGAFLATFVAALVLRTMAALGRAEAAVAVALLAAGLADSLVGQGAWQGWWPAAIGASLVWFRYGRYRPNGVVHGSA